MIEKVPPYSQQSEEAVIGMALIDPAAAAKIMTDLKPDNFYFKNLGLIFRHMQKLYIAGKPVDLVSVSSSLTASSEMIDAGGSRKLMDLVNSQATSANIKYYADEIRKLSTLRGLISAGSQIVEMGFHGADDDIERVLSDAEQKIFALNQSGDQSGLVHVESPAWDFYESLTKAYDSNERVNPRVVDTGFKDLNVMLGGGLNPSDFVVLAARPSMGKTALAFNVAANICEQMALPVAVFSLEMSSEQCTSRLISMYSGVQAQKMKSLSLSADDWVHISSAVERVSAMPLYIDESNVLSPGDLLSKCRKLKSEQKDGKKLGAIVIDYIQLMAQAMSSERGRTHETVSLLARQLKLLAKEMDCPVIALSQLSRGVESRTEKRPVMSDIKESGGIEEAADLVMLLYRDEYYNPDTVNKNVAEVIVGKNRNGPTGTIRLFFDQTTTNFENLDLNTETNCGGMFNLDLENDI